MFKVEETLVNITFFTVVESSQYFSAYCHNSN